MSATLEAHGHDALEARVARAHDEFVGSGDDDGLIRADYQFIA